MNDGIFYLALFVIVGVLGIRGSWRLTRRYHDVSPQLVERERLILLAFVIVAWLVTVAAAYFGFLTVRRLLGFEPLPELAPVSALVAFGVFMIPAFLDAVVDRVARVPWGNGS